MPLDDRYAYPAFYFFRRCDIEEQHGYRFAGDLYVHRPDLVGCQDEAVRRQFTRDRRRATG